ncbi:MAG: hypothetical protein JKX85_16360 [Phycisphaeraceae bacterium]|nr:hypothetical protein [Phycisphaeraceae bacterium]
MATTNPSPIILLTATVVEMLPLVKQMQLKKQSPLSWQGQVAGIPVIAQVTGMGAQRAAQAVREAAQLFAQSRIVYAGFAGALDRSLDLGSIISPAAIFNEDKLTIDVDGQMTQSIVSVDKIISTPQLKTQLAHATGAVAVDMESYGAAAAAKQLGITLTIIRSISDTAEQTLPTWSAHCIKANGQTSLRGVLWTLLSGPWRISEMLLMQKQAKIASESLAYFVEGKMGQWALN